MAEAAHALVAQFFNALGAGTLAEETFTPGATVWTLTTKTDNPATKYLRGTKILASLFPGGLVYSIRSITAEDDRVAAEAIAKGVLQDGRTYRNHYVMLFRLDGGRIASLAEYFDPKPVEELIMPLLAAAMREAPSNNH